MDLDSTHSDALKAAAARGLIKTAFEGTGTMKWCTSNAMKSP